MRLRQRILQLVIFLGIFVLPGAADAAESPYYKGKTLTVLVNFAAGGLTDIEGRLVAKYLPRFIPGSPTIVVNNMPGAGGIIATNYLGEMVKPDGLTMSYFTGNFFNILLADPVLRVNLAKFAYIASIEGSSVAYIRKDVPPGLSNAQDILKAQTFRTGGLTAVSTKDVRFRLQLDLLGAKYSYVTGYVSNTDARLALQRNEIQYFVEGLPAYRATVEPQMVKTGVVIPLYVNELLGEDGELEANADAPDLMPFSKLYQSIHKKAPSGRHWDALKVTYIAQAMQRVVMMTPGTSPEIVATLRQAFTTMVKDPEFVAEFRKVTRSEPEYKVGISGEKIVQKLQDTPADIKAFIKKYTENK